MLVELIFASLMNAINLAMLINETRRAAAKQSNEMRELKSGARRRRGIASTGTADLLRMTQTALTSQKTSGRTDQGKFATYFTRGLAGDSRLALDYCAELVTNAFRLTPLARRRDAPDSLLNSSKACLTHYNGPSKHFWRTRLT